MLEHQLIELLKVSVKNIEDIANVDMVVGEAFNQNGFTIIPVCKIKYRYLACGLDEEEKKSNLKEAYPFGGGAGAMTNITPIAFLVCKDDEIKVLHLEENTHIIETIVDFVPQLISKIIKEVKKVKPAN